MARTYKRDSRGRFAGGGGGSSGGGGKKSSGGKGRGTVAERKAAVVKRVSGNALAGRKNTSTSRSYVRAQQGEKVAMGSRGKGNKAARRAAEVTARAAASKPTKRRGAPAGPRGGKVGSAKQQQAARLQQEQRNRTFSSKSTAGRSAKAAYKAAKGKARWFANSPLGASAYGAKAKNAAARVRRMERTRTAAPKKRGRPRKAG